MTARHWTLRSRLLASFLIFALFPGVILIIVITQALPWALDQWARKDVRDSFENALVVARDTLTRIENDLRQRWALTVSVPELSRWRLAAERGPELPLPNEPTLEEMGMIVGTRFNVDFVQVCPAEPDSAWTAIATLTRDPLVDAPHGLTKWGPGDLNGGLFLKGSRGELAFAQRIPRPGHDEPGPVMVVGIYLDPTFYEKLDDLSSAVTRHDIYYKKSQIWKTGVYVASALFVIVLVLTGSFIAGRLSKSLSRPVEVLASGMGKVSQGELDVVLEPQGSEEMRSLITSFNQMTAELVESKASLARAERVAAWQDAARRIAHEIRNPLQPITLALHRIEKSVADDPARREIVRAATGSILEEVEALKKLAAAFSEFARMPDPELEVTDLGAFVQNSLFMFQYPRVIVTYDPPATEVFASIDRHQIRQVLTNLVKNAAEAMPDGGRIRLSVGASPEEEAVWIEVEDSGPGIPADMKARIFQPYYTTKKEGSGLGLAIVERIVAAHGGSLEVVSSGRGALFRIHLAAAGPGARPANAEAPTPVEKSL